MSRIDKSVAQNIADKIFWLSENVEFTLHVPLKGQFKGKYKLRIGNWRVVYSLEHSQQSITIYAVRHRSEVYKN
ncbi:MAG: type II toxin-antitoxin system RelE/ParE family toxin [Nitrospirae bacterium]|nr:type II toxin-antitoxin system RelE/ParE family toxin [Nitrospirota bacterium]